MEHLIVFLGRWMISEGLISIDDHYR